MAEKTEAPTQRRRREAREKGNVARSPEVNTAIGLLTAFTVLKSVGPGLSERVASVAASLLSGRGMALDTPEALRATMLRLSAPLLLAAAPFVMAVMLAGVAASMGQVGLLFSGESLKPQFNRVNPLSGFKRLFSSKGLEELAKASAKVLIIGWVAYRALVEKLPLLLNLSRMELRAASFAIWSVATGVGSRVGLVMLVIAAADYFFQRRQLENSLRMTKQELIEEMKLYDNPIIRQRIRQQQRRIAMQRMMAAVPKADVVITNPTHIAVAIKYDASTMRAPKLVAKGQELTAKRIREVAEENGVPIVERRPLARALYKMVDIGMEIPVDLYQAVAEVLAFIYSLKGVRQ
jgi:flagellar biosynthetic protein FlhB